MTDRLRIYIAGPMSGLPGNNYPAFNAAEDQLGARGFIPLNPVHVAARCVLGVCEHDWQWYMRRSLAMMLTADRVALLPGWENSRGARIERTLAHDLGIPVSPIDLLLYTDVVAP